MKRVFIALSLAVDVLIGVLLYERLFVESWFGPSALAALLVLVVLSLALLLSGLGYSRHRDRILNTWMVLCASGGSFLFLDLVAGQFLIKPLSPQLLPDSILHHKLLPGTYSRIEQADFSYVQRVNNLGMRGADVTESKPPGVFRILMLGDSFTMGKGVEDHETFSVLLEHRMGERTTACGGRPVQVLNGGVDSYAPILSALQLEQLVSLEPDLVVLNLDVSDFAQEQMYRRSAVFGYDGRVLRVPGGLLADPSLTDRIRTWVDRNLFFTRAVLVRINKTFGFRSIAAAGAVGRSDPELVNYTLASDTVDRRQQWADLFQSLDRIKATSERGGAAFLLTVYPWPHQYSDTSWSQGRYEVMAKDAVPSSRSVETIKALATEHRIELLDLYPAFRAYRGTEDLYYRGDPHWTRAGHRVVSAGLAEYFESRYLARWCGKNSSVRLQAGKTGEPEEKAVR